MSEKTKQSLASLRRSLKSYEKKLKEGKLHVSSKLFDYYNKWEGFKEEIYNLLESCGLATSLSQIDLEGWFYPLANYLEGMDLVRFIVGDDFLVFSFILNIQLVSLQIEEELTNSIISFYLPKNSTLYSMNIKEFRKKVSELLLSCKKGKNKITTLEPPLTVEKVKTALEAHNILLASHFKIKFFRSFLIFSKNSPPELYIEFYEGKENKRKILSLKEIIKMLDKIVEDKLNSIDTYTPIDLTIVSKAETLFEEEQYHSVIELLKSWTELISPCYKLKCSKLLPEGFWDSFIKGILLLLKSLMRSGELNISESLIRSILTFIKDNNEYKNRYMGELFVLMGEIFSQKSCSGEAIGYFRRGLYHGYIEKKNLELLRKAYIDEKKIVASIYLLKELYNNDLYKLNLLLDELNLDEEKKGFIKELILYLINGSGEDKLIINNEQDI